MQDRRLVGMLVQREIEARTTWSAFAAQTNLSRSTLYRVRDADPRISKGTFLRIERALSYPTDTFDSIAKHDFDVLHAMGIDGETVAWLERQATTETKTSAALALVTPPTPSTRDTEPESEKD